MVCSTGTGQMTSMGALLEAGRTSRTSAEEVNRWKLAAQYIHRELREADEANLIDEEDMHVFGLKPMRDPLDLVCCNFCKKPVKMSQYAAHAGICRSLISVEERVPELDGGAGHKKPPRKERKKLQSNYAIASVGELEKVKAVDGDNITELESHLEQQTQFKTALATDAKIVNPGNTDHSTDAMQPSKRLKLIAADSLLISDHIERASGVTKSLCISTQHALTCGDPKESKTETVKTSQNAEFQFSRQIHGCCLKNKGISNIPAPLATKIFYSQRNHRFRAELSRLYYESSARKNDQNLRSMDVFQENTVSPLNSLPGNSFHEQIDYPVEKISETFSPSMPKSGESLSQKTIVDLDDSGTCPNVDNSDQFPLNNVLGPYRNPVPTSGSNRLSNHYSFAGNSVKSLGGMEQPKGSVPVV